MMNFLKDTMNKALDVLLRGNVKDDMDDTLLEKFLTWFEKACHGGYEYEAEKFDPVDILRNTKLMDFFETCVSLLNDPLLPSDVHIVSFGIRALGIFVSQEKFFLFIERHYVLLPSLLKVYEKGFTSHVSSIQSSLLFCGNEIAKHSSGLKWIVEIFGILENIFNCFSAKSYYTRKDACQLLRNLFIKWHSEEYEKGTCNKNINQLFDDLILSHIFPALNNSNNSFEKECCISLLRTSMESSVNLRHVFCVKHKLIDRVVRCFEAAESSSDVSENMILLFVDCYIHSQSGNTKVITDILDFFMKNLLVSSAMTLVTSLLISEGKDQISQQQIDVVLWPLLLSVETCADNAPSVKYKEILDNVKSYSNEWMSLVRTSIICCKRLLPYLNHDAVNQVMVIACEFLNKHYKQDDADILLTVFESSKIMQSILDLALSIIALEGFSQLNATLHMQLLKSLCFMATNWHEPRLTSASLNVIHKLVEATDISTTCSDELTTLLWKKLINLQGPVFENCLDIIHYIGGVCKETDKPWIDLVYSKEVFNVARSLIMSVEYDTFIRATAVEIIFSFCIKSFHWNESVAMYRVNVDEVVSSLSEVSEKYDIFPQESSVHVLMQFFNVFKNDNSKCCSFVYDTLERIVQYSPDSDCQIAALTAWQAISDNIIFPFITGSEENAHQIVTTLMQNGFCSSLLHAFDDHNIRVHEKAVSIFLELRRKLSQAGITKNSAVFNSANNSPATSLNSVSKSLASDAQKEDAKEETVNTSTINMIQNITVDKTWMLSSRSEELSASKYVARQSCTTRFWDVLWSNDIESRLAMYSSSSDIYSNNPIALLEDIIAAENLNPDEEWEFQEVDCY